MRFHPSIRNMDLTVTKGREVMLEFLSDNVFVEDLLWWYDLDFSSLFKIIYGDYVPLLSSTAFIRKVKKVLLSSSYIDKPVVTDDKPSE